MKSKKKVNLHQYRFGNSAKCQTLLVLNQDIYEKYIH